MRREGEGAAGIFLRGSIVLSSFRCYVLKKYRGGKEGKPASFLCKVSI